MSISLLCLENCEQSCSLLHSEHEVYCAFYLETTDTSRTWLLPPSFDGNGFLWYIHTRILLLIYEACLQCDTGMWCWQMDMRTCAEEK